MTGANASHDAVPVPVRSATAHRGDTDPVAPRFAVRRVAGRFTRYSALSLLTIPTGYSLLLFARHLWDVNAGLLNLGIGTVLTLPSFFLYRRLVWREGSGRGVGAELFSFWQTVMAGALAASALIAVEDAWFGASGPLIVLAGLTGQGIVFVARFVWLEKVTFARRRSGV